MIIFQPIRGADFTLRGMMDEIARLQREHPELEVFLDGDEYAIVGRERR